MLATTAMLAHPLMADEVKAQAKPASSVAEAFTDGAVKFQFRYRFENVDQKNALNDANASTLKSRIIYNTKKYRDLTAMVEVDDVTAIGNDGYYSLRNDQAGKRSVVADPEGTEINQAWINYSGVDDTNIKYGRQRINLDNQRFIGGVGWRQNEQTYDGLHVSNASVKDLELSYAYIYNVNRIFGPDEAASGQPPADLDSRAHVINAQYKGLPLGTLSAYGYLLDFKDADELSNKTLGVRFSGKQKIDNDFSALYTLEYAMQDDYGDNISYDADYYLLEGGVSFQNITAKIGYEVLEGDPAEGDPENDRAFITPLATLHKFQGWADQFLGTPGSGIEDTYVHASVKAFGATMTAVYHEFDMESGGGSHGDELDVAIVKKFSKHVTGLLKYADYNADQSNVDTEKLWIQAVISF